MLAAIDADHASEATPFAGFHPSQRILKQDYTRWRNIETASDLEKQGRSRLAREAERLSVKPVDAGIEMMLESGSVQNGGGILAR